MTKHPMKANVIFSFYGVLTQDIINVSSNGCDERDTCFKSKKKKNIILLKKKKHKKIRRKEHHFEQEKQEQHLSKKERKTLFDQKKR